MILTPLKLYATIALFAILVITGGGLLAKIEVLKLQVSTLQKDAALEGQRTAEAVTKAVQAERDLETARQVAQQKVINDAAAQHLKDVADATAARTERDRLRVAAKADAARYRATRSDPALVTAGPNAPDALDVLVDVLGRVDDTAGQLAEYADNLHTSLAACIGSYVALTPATTVTESTSP
jgi:hypothetical protein